YTNNTTFKDFVKFLSMLKSVIIKIKKQVRN
ncbi:MAG: hypothetical protein ACJAX4_002635, partial [Clostridium sp.]